MILTMARRLNRLLSERSALIVLIAFYFLWLASGNIFDYSLNQRLTLAFDSDEALHIDIISNALKNNAWVFPMHSYGHLFFYIALFIVKIVSLFHLVNDQTILIVLRTISLIATFLSCVALFDFLRPTFDRVFSWIIPISLMTIPLNLAEYSLISHPDTLQLLFVVLGVNQISKHIETNQQKHLYFASVFAGLAFSTKYSGLFVLILIWMVALTTSYSTKRTSQHLPQIPSKAIHLFSSLLLVGVFCSAYYFDIDKLLGFFGGRTSLNSHEIDQFTKIRRLLLLAAPLGILAIPFTKKLTERVGSVVFWSTLIFFSIFSLTSPGLLLGLGFVKGMLAESLHVGFGHSFRASRNIFEWFPILFSKDLLGIGLGVFALSTLALQIYLLARRRCFGSHSEAKLALCAIWSSLYFGYVLFRVNYREARYLFIILPHLLTLSFFGLHWTLGQFSKSKTYYKVALTAIFLLLLTNGIQRVLQFKTQRSELGAENSPAQISGNWLKDNYPEGIKVAQDYYTYVPPYFTKVKKDWTWTLRELKDFEPQVVVVNTRQAARFEDKTLANDYFHGSEAFQETHNFYSYFLRSKNTNYRLVFQMDPIRIYANDSLLE